jgi:hypothetical protein
MISRRSCSVIADLMIRQAILNPNLGAFNPWGCIPESLSWKNDTCLNWCISYEDNLELTEGLPAVRA